MDLDRCLYRIQHFLLRSASDIATRMASLKPHYLPSVCFLLGSSLRWHPKEFSGHHLPLQNP